MPNTFLLLPICVVGLAVLPAVADEHGRERRNGWVRGQVEVVFDGGLPADRSYRASDRGCWDCDSRSWKDSKEWEKDRREAQRERQKDLREVWREREKDRREAARKWEKAEQEAWREDRKARAEWERERDKAQREAAREWYKDRRKD
jgi:hypothetical protein